MNTDEWSLDAAFKPKPKPKSWLRRLLRCNMSSFLAPWALNQFDREDRPVEIRMELDSQDLRRMSAKIKALNSNRSREREL